MKKQKAVRITTYVLAALLIAITSYFIGCKTTYDRMENAQSDNSTETFYAQIIAISDNGFSVTGIDLNDINHRGEFDLTIVEETELVWREEPMNISEFQVGDNISITYTGGIQETAPAQIPDVVKVQLLDDEK